MTFVRKMRAFYVDEIDGRGVKQTDKSQFDVHTLKNDDQMNQ